MIKAVIFDMDGLLVDSEPTWRKVEIACFKQVGVHLSDADCMRTKGLRIDEVIDFWYSKTPWTGLSKKELVDLIVSEMIQEMKANARPLPGVLETIQLVKEKGIKIAVASSSMLALIEAIIQGLNLIGVFDELCSAEHEAYGKPHPSVFLTTAKKLDVHPESCLVLEDSIPGVIAAKAAKMKCIAVPDTPEQSLPQFSIADAELESLLEFKAHHLSLQ